MLLRVKPSHELQRTPRPIQTTQKFWKASEYRAWLLFYAIPILKDLLPADYVHHLSLLVSAMHILLGAQISIDDITAAHQMLQLFYQFIPKLYPRELCTANAHSLIHLSDFVRRWRPLWCYSTFGFENMNGFLRKHCHGTRNILPQMIDAICTRQALPLLHQKLAASENEATMTFLEKVSSVNGDRATGILGRVKHQKRSVADIQALSESNFPIESIVPVFPRFRQNSVVYHSRDFTRDVHVRDSSVCLLRLSRPGVRTEVLFGSIRTLCLVGRVPVAIVCIYERTHEGIMKELRRPQHSELIIFNNMIDSFIF